MSGEQMTAGRVAFDAYRKARGGRNHDGSETPGWDGLTAPVREGWEAAAEGLLLWAYGSAADAEIAAVRAVLEADGFDVGDPASAVRGIVEELIHASHPVCERCGHASGIHGEAGCLFEGRGGLTCDCSEWETSA